MHTVVPLLWYVNYNLPHTLSNLEEREMTETIVVMHVCQ